MNSADAIERYRALHATIKYASGELPVHRVLLVDVDRSSSSKVAENVARAFARAGDSCVLVDANLRAASDGAPGLADLVRGVALGEIDVRRDDDGLARIGSGTEPNPDLLAGDGLERAFDALRGEHEYLIATCAPLPEFGDAVAIAAHVDAVILVISAGVTGREAAIRARDALERVGSRMLGLVMVERPRRWF